MMKCGHTHVERQWPTLATVADDRRTNPSEWQRYEFAQQHVSGKRVLDCACGAGYGSWLMAKAGATSVVGLDLSKEALGWAQREFSHAGVEYRLVQPGEPIPVEPETFDVAVSFETVEHVEPDKAGQFVGALARSLAPGGRLIMSTPLTYGPARLRPENPFHLREYQPEELQSLLDPYFEIEKRLGQHSGGSWRLSEMKRAPGLGTLLKAGAHRLLPSRVRDQLRAFLLDRASASANAWISEDRWRDAAVQIVIARRRESLPSEGTAAAR